MVTLHEVITFLVSMQISISSLQTHNVNRCGRSRHLARKLSLRRKRSSPNVFEMAATETITSIILIKLIRRSEERFSRNAETDLVCRLLLEKKKVVPADVRQLQPARVQPGDMAEQQATAPGALMLLVGLTRLLHPDAQADE